MLLATDVAARGLDIASVDHVIHYQLPRSADLYVHRSGRTARAGARGVSVAICSPEEKRIMRDLWRALGRTTDIGDLPIEHAFLEPLRKRLDLARQIDNASHKMSKASHDAAWIANLAAEADLALDSDDELEDPDEDMGRKKKAKGGPSGREAKTAHAKVQALKAELAQLLAKPLTARGVSHRYITSGSNSFVADLINDARE